MFDKGSQKKRIVGSGGSGEGHFSKPNGISIKGDVMYVADYGNDRIQKLTTEGGSYKSLANMDQVRNSLLNQNQLLLTKEIG